MNDQQLQAIAVSRPIQVRKSRFHGWMAETYFKIQSEGQNKGRSLKVSTSKGSNGLLSTFAQVMDVNEHTESFTMFADPFVALNKGEKTRATEKTVQEQHTRALADMLAADLQWLHVRK